MQDAHWIQIQDCRGKNIILNEEVSLDQKTGLKVKEESNRLLHLELSLVWCWNLDTSGSRSEIPESFKMWCWRKNGQDHLNV